MNPTRVLLLVENNGFPRDFRVRREAKALLEQGYEVSVICPREGDQRWSECVDGVHVFRFPHPPDGNGVLGFAFEFAYATLAILALSLWVALRHGVDVVHAANPPDTLFVVGACFRLMGKQFVFDHHDLAPEVYQTRFDRPRRDLIYLCLRAAERCSFAVSNVVVSTNESYRRRAIEFGRMAPDKVFVVRNGPPLSYKPLPPPASLVGRPEHIVGYVGTIGPQDGVDRWLRAVHHMVHVLRRHDFLALVIGDGDAMPALRQLTAELKIEPYVLFTGRLGDSEVRSHLSAAAVCVQPDPPSPLNNVSTMNKLMEYMALSKPTVAFDLHETRVSGGDAVVYVAGEDIAAFARDVTSLLDDPPRRQRMGLIGRDRVTQSLAWEYSARSLAKAYSEGLGAVPIVRNQRETA
jgi:glycosyltransferase involved in cell wall biosynthesis